MPSKVVPIFVLLAVTACHQQASEPAGETQAAGRSIYQNALVHPNRRAADHARDAGRKPAEVLEFFGIESGMTVLDLFSGGGYYSELLAYVVGPDGKVVAHSNKAYLNFVGDEFNERYADGRLSNVEVLMAENNELELPADAFDAVTMILTYHDLFYVSPENGWPKIDGPRLLAQLFKGMKPGAVLGVVDHYAEAGSPRETGNTVHRIDPGIVISELEIAGFVLDGKSDILRNMDDDYNKIVFDPELRGKTDRFVLRFRKPE
ncbi:MAG: class I SAM-dependent methyltransferase [Woeseia sp.]